MHKKKSICNIVPCGVWSVSWCLRSSETIEQKHRSRKSVNSPREKCEVKANGYKTQSWYPLIENEKARAAAHNPKQTTRRSNRRWYQISKLPGFDNSLLERSVLKSCPCRVSENDVHSCCNDASFLPQNLIQQPTPMEENPAQRYRVQVGAYK